MKSKIYIWTLILLTTCSCNKSANSQKIKELEERIGRIENELKGNSETILSNKQPSSKVIGKKDYFIIGSTEDDVLSVMGDPDKYSDYRNGSKTFYYRGSSVHFSQGRVEGYSNLSENLKVRVK